MPTKEDITDIFFIIRKVLLSLPAIVRQISPFWGFSTGVVCPKKDLICHSFVSKELNIINTKVITKIEIQKKDKNRCSVFINEEFAFGMDLDCVIKYDIQKGNRYTNEEYDNLLQKLQYEKAKFAALRYINYSPRSIKETTDKLRTLQFEESVIEKTIDFLLSYDYLNDLEYAKVFIRTRIEGKRYGRNKVSYDLIMRGVGKEISGPILEQYQDAEYEGATYLYNKRTKGKKLKDHKERAKITRYLQGRGYSYETIKDVIQESTQHYI